MSADDSPVPLARLRFIDPTTKRLDEIALALPSVVPSPIGAKATAKPRGFGYYAMRWTAIVARRLGWRAVESALAPIQREAENLLTTLGVTHAHLGRLASAGIVEVAIPHPHGRDGWAAQIMPWEYVISAATRRERGSLPLLVVRWLDCRGPETSRTATSGRPGVLFVESGPGSLGAFYDFKAERLLVAAALGRDDITEERKGRLKNPTADDLKARLAASQIDVLHITGADLRQGIEIDSGLIKGRGRPATPAHAERAEDRDGMYLAGPTGAPTPLTATGFAKLLGSSPPALVALNLYNSAARTAALAVGAGAGAAIGFQDCIDDAVAEIFFALFYRGWRVGDRSLLAAFGEALVRIEQSTARLHGTGIVLWSRRSLLESESADRREGLRSKIRLDLAEAARTPLDPTMLKVDRDLHVRVEPLEQLNYSLLHNRRRLFKRFQIVKPRTGTIDLDVLVRLQVGAEPCECRSRITVDGEVHDLSRDIMLSLSPALPRALTDALDTNLFVEVRAKSTIFFRSTYRTRLLPVMSWRDDLEVGGLLPSFVLSGDPAVSRIIDASQRYLCALADDVGQGFDGYQSVDPSAKDPSSIVDDQVRAIWAALILEFPIGYVNPPPSFWAQVQRLRTPSEVVDGRRGTCIDLALLVAACLEYVEIYPAIFLLSGHAFPGYWRSSDAYEKFVSRLGLQAADDVDLDPSPETSFEADTSFRTTPWRIGPEHGRAVREAVEHGHLVPLESTLLARRSGFLESIEAGTQNLSDARDFDSLVLVPLARAEGVTPLPIIRSAR